MDPGVAIPSRDPGDASGPPSLGPEEDVFLFPASFAQQRLWFVDQLDPGNTAYSLPILWRVTGELAFSALERALDEIVCRHEILRTTFSLKQWEVIQVISPVRTVRVTTVDLSHVPGTEREERARSLADQEIRRPFDLREGPLFRAHLWRLTNREHLLLLNMHHIIADGWSFGVLTHELGTLYEAFREGRDSPLPEPSLQYADFAEWQRASLEDGALETHLSFWRETLAGTPPALDLRTDRPRPPRQTFNGAYETELLPAHMTERIKSFSRAEGVTPFMTLLAAFLAVLSRHTGQTDIVVGSPIANRTRVELEPLIGLFINTLVLRGDLSGNPTFRELLGRTSRTALDAYAHQDMPFEKLVEELKQPRDRSRNPVFQVMFVHQKAFLQPFDAGGLRFLPLKVDRGGALADICLFIIERDEGLRAGLEYNTDLFDASTMRRMLGHLGTLLAAAVEDPSIRLDSLPLLRPTERRQLLVEWNQTESEVPRDECLHQLFEAQVEKTPGQIALVFETKELTYRELNSRANRLARHLVRMGVGPGARVGVCMERFLEMVVGLLAILKAGGAYVPLDPSYPRERLVFLLDDASPSVVLTLEKFAGAIPFSGTLLCLDAIGSRLDEEGEENLAGRVAPDDLAYLIYTSGSTGRPKGVMVPHRGVVNYLTWCLDAYAVSSGRGAPVQSPLSFDLTVTSLFAPLVCGGTVRLLAEKPAGAALAELFDEPAGWSLVKTTPSELELLSRQVAPAKASGRTRAFVVGGESLNAEMLAFWRETAPGTKIFNEYGPTETVVGCCVYEVGDVPICGPVPIGRPIANTRLYILGPDGQPVPIGVIGELCIAGVGVARGYWNMPELTAERFVGDPFRSPGSRMYRSGDFARYRPDGNIEYVGRRDSQVKVRGYRIELGEIEAALEGHPAVRRSAVLAREDVPSEKRLVAYAEAGRASAVTETQLRAFLKERLPAHMVPSAFLILESLPQSPNGKIDRRALPAPAPTSQGRDADRIAPSDPVEARLVAIWEDVLGVRGIGIGEDYFDLGGHSLLAVRLFSRIEDAFGRHLPLATIFEAPTIAQLAEKLRDDGREAPGSSLVVIQRGSGRPPFFCVPGVGGNILGYSDLARQLGPEQPVYGLQAQGLDGKSEPLARVEDMAAHYIREIRAVFPDGPFLLGGASFGGRVAFEIARQLDASGDPVGLVALFDAFAPLSPASSSPPSILDRRLKGWVARLKYHGKNLLFGTGRRGYVVRKSRTLRRRIRSRIWRMFYEHYRKRPGPLPQVLQDVREAGYLANRKYVPGPYRGSVILFRAGVRSAADAETADMGWSRLALGGVEIREVPGDHVDMLLRPQVASLAAQLRHCIDEAIGRADLQRLTAVPAAPLRNRGRG